jgi:predicted RNA-binding protein with RPS1 domain
MRRFEILWLHVCDKFVPEIADIVQQYVHTVRDVITMFRQGGVELVTKIDSNHPQSDHEEHRVAIIEEFKNGINNCLDKVETDYKEEIKKLMTPKFQNFKKEQLVAL